MIEKVAADGITMERTLRELARIAYGDLRAVVNWESKGVDIDEETGAIKVCNEVTLTDSKALDPATAAAIAEISQKSDGTLKVKMHAKQPALLALLKHLIAAEAASTDKKPVEKSEPAPTFNRFAPRPPPKMMSH